MKILEISEGSGGGGGNLGANFGKSSGEGVGHMANPFCGDGMDISNPHVQTD